MSRIWQHRPLGENECHVRDTLLRAIDVKPNQGEKILLSVDLISLMNV